jgi:DNA/RNA-binding domain of Phe-tRNA-synthetase-like protein
VNVIIDPKVSEKFPGVDLVLMPVGRLKVKNSHEEIEKIKRAAEKALRGVTPDQYMEVFPWMTAYRSFSWKLGIDPTKMRIAGEALARRVWNGHALPTINTVVDVYCTVSARFGIAISAYDAKKLKGDVHLRYAGEGEEFFGIGMDKPHLLRGNELLVTDNKKPISIFMHRDADRTKVTRRTKEVLLLGYVVPGIDPHELAEEMTMAVGILWTYCR